MTAPVSSSSTLQAFYEILPVDACVVVLSFLDYPDLIRFFCASKSIQYLREANGNYAERSIFARVEIFDRTKWMEYRNAEITDKYDRDKIEVCRMRAFQECYWGPNPVGPGRVKDHCLVPTVVPTKLKVQGIQLHHCLNVEEFLAQRPKEGPAAKFTVQTEALKQHGNARTENDELVIYLKDVQARDESWKTQVQYLKDLNNKTGYGCVVPDINSQVSVTLAHFQFTGERSFGDDTGMEGRYTCGRTGEEVYYEGDKNPYQMISGYFSDGQPLGPLGGSAPAELDVYGSRYDGEDGGVGVCRKF